MIDPARVRELFDAVSELPAADHGDFLARECRSQPELLAQLQSLLASEARAEASGFLHRPAMHDVARQTALEMPQPASRAGELLGRYRIVRLLGTGGMGEVYLAEDTDLARQVALKVIKNGVRTSDLLDRFDREGRILAHLNHESIARLLDAGTSAAGVPFLVMEYVEGKPITEHCDWEALPVEERLKLFRVACAAVQYAHQNVVVHRDLKPGNILVTAAGQVKLLDFGIAKLLDAPLAEAGATMLPALTPEYASPEQVRGEVTTTATDVYSLGVVLHELLTGSGLYVLKRRTSAEMLKAICEQEPRPPSAAAGASRVAEAEGGAEKLRRHLLGDLDQIVLKALRKEPEARYPTVEQFSDDIGRHLEGLPVMARRRTFSYRAAKYVRRNRVGVVAAAVALLTLVAGIVTTSLAAREAMAQRAAAQKRFEEARRLAHTVLFDYHDLISALPGSTQVRQRFVTDALTYLSGMSKDMVGDHDLQVEVAAAYIRVGDVQGRPYAPNLGQTEAALASYRKALSILEPIVASRPVDAPARRQLANAHERIGLVQLRKFQFDQATGSQRQALAMREQLSTQNPADAGIRGELAESRMNFGDALQATCFTGRGVTECLLSALESQRQALAMFQELSRAHPDDVQLRRDIASVDMKIAFRLRDLAVNQHDVRLQRQSLESHHRAMQIREEIVAADPTNVRDRRNAADQRMLLADAQMTAGDLTSALAGYRRSTATFQSLVEIDPVNAEARRDLSFAHQKMGLALAKSGANAAALDSYRAAMACAKQLLADDPNGEDRQTLNSANERAATTAEAMGNFPLAIQYYQDFVDASPPDPYVAYRLGRLNLLAARNGPQAAVYWKGARDAFRLALDLLRKDGGDESKNASVRHLFQNATRDLSVAECAQSCDGR